MEWIPHSLQSGRGILPLMREIWLEASRGLEARATEEPEIKLEKSKKPMRYDLIIRGGTVIDGSGQAGFPADVGVQDDRIVAVGSLAGDATQTIDASGRVVTPGFIDAHSHDDFALLDRPLCDFKLMQGVTTEIIGNCGFGAAPANDAYRNFLRGFGVILFGPLGDFSWETTQEFYHALEKYPAAVNVAPLVPHAAVRYGVLENTKHTPSSQELSAMQALVREGMQASETDDC